MKRLLEVLRLAEKHLEEKRVSSPRLSAELLLADVLGVERLQLYLEFERPLEETELEKYRGHIRRRAAHEPVQYITGETAFRELTLATGPGVLVPRPETETLVQLVLDWLRQRESNHKARAKILDLCAGSGAVGLSLAAEQDGVLCILADNSPDALGWAARNLSRACPAGESSSVSILCCDLFSALSPSEADFDIVVANPPYVAPAGLDSLPPDVRQYEPLAALDGGDPEGAAVIGEIVRRAHEYMTPGALLAMEIGENQQDAVRNIFSREGGPYTSPAFHEDLTGRTRFVTANKK